MNHQARSLPVTNRNAASGKGSISFRIVTEHPGNHPAGKNRCLLCLVPLEQKAQRYPLVRRLRSRDNLAGGSARRNAALLARDPVFWDYLQLISLTAYDQEIDTRRARYFINRVCGVQGRQELDRIESAAQNFFQLIEKPFLEWLLSDE